MERTLYYLELRCIKDVKYPNTEFHTQEVVWFKPDTRAGEMYLFNYKLSDEELGKLGDGNPGKYRGLPGDWGYLPFTRQKRYAKKWKVRSYPEHIARVIDSYGEFKCEVKEIKITYAEIEEEEN